MGKGGKCFTYINIVRVYTFQVGGMELALKKDEKEGDKSEDVSRLGQADPNSLEKKIENLQKIIEGRLETEEANFNGTNLVIE